MFSPFHSAGGHGLACIVVIATASRSEIKWLQMWWPAQTNETKAKFRAIVRSGQLEFAGAGWSQNDVMRLPGGLWLTLAAGITGEGLRSPASRTHAP